MTHKERPWLTILKFVEMGTVGYIFLTVIWPKLRMEPYRDENHLDASGKRIPLDSIVKRLSSDLPF